MQEYDNKNDDTMQPSSSDYLSDEEKRKFNEWFELNFIESSSAHELENLTSSCATQDSSPMTHQENDLSPKIYIETLYKNIKKTRKKKSKEKLNMTFLYSQTNIQFNNGQICGGDAQQQRIYDQCDQNSFKRYLSKAILDDHNKPLTKKQLEKTFNVFKNCGLINEKITRDDRRKKNKIFAKLYKWRPIIMEKFTKEPMFLIPILQYIEQTKKEKTEAKNMK